MSSAVPLVVSIQSLLSRRVEQNYSSTRGEREPTAVDGYFLFESLPLARSHDEAAANIKTNKRDSD